MDGQNFEFQWKLKGLYTSQTRVKPVSLIHHTGPSSKSMADDVPSPALPRSSTGSMFPIRGERCPTVKQSCSRARTTRFAHSGLPRMLVVEAINRKYWLRGSTDSIALTLVCEVIRYRLVQVRQNLKKKKKTC